MQPQRPPQCHEAVPIRAHEVRHRLAVEMVPMKPNAAVEGEAHPLAAAREFSVGRFYWQTIRPSIIPGKGGLATLPEKR